MKAHRTEAIVLHTYPARERDKLVVFLTPDLGKRKGWAYGARSIKSRFGASLEPLSKVRIGYMEKESEEVVRIQSVDLIRSLFPAQQNLLANVAATYLAETIDTFAQPDDPSEVMYRLLDRGAEALLSGLPPLAVVAYAEIWILKLTGVFPSLKQCGECGNPIERPLRFDPSMSSFVCEGCSARGVEILPNELVDELSLIMKLPVEEFAAHPPVPALLFEIRSLAASIRRSFLGHELKSYEVLAGIQ